LVIDYVIKGEPMTMFAMSRSFDIGFPEVILLVDDEDYRDSNALNIQTSDERLRGQHTINLDFMHDVCTSDSCSITPYKVTMESTGPYNDFLFVKEQNSYFSSKLDASRPMVWPEGDDDEYTMMPLSIPLVIDTSDLYEFAVLDDRPHFIEITVAYQGDEEGGNAPLEPITMTLQIFKDMPQKNDQLLMFITPDTHVTEHNRAINATVTIPTKIIHNH
jgi:hypothetical protein